MKKSKVVVIGAGAVGSTTAFTLLLKNTCEEIVLIDVNVDKAKGDALDMKHGLPFIGKAKIYAGTYADCVGADIIIITAGAAQKTGETRIDLMKRNLAIFDSILGEISNHTSEGVILVASNPVDIMSYYSKKKLSHWPMNRLIGSGTLLDSARFRFLISEKLNLNPQSVHAHIIGEHGDSELPVWSLANVAGAKLELSAEEMEDIFVHTRDAAYEIIHAKGATFYAIAVALDRICRAILKDEGSVLTVSTQLQDYHGLSDVYLGVPCIVDRSGVREVLPIALDKSEKEKLHASADKLKKAMKEFGI